MPVYRHPESGDRVIPSNDESGRQYVETLERAGYVLVEGSEAEETELERVTRERDQALARLPKKAKAEEEGSK